MWIAANGKGKDEREREKENKNSNLFIKAKVIATAYILENGMCISLFIFKKIN